MNTTGLLKVLGNETRVYSPITLNTAWPTLWRLMFIFFFTFIGTIINGFFVAAFFIEQHLRSRGHVYLACSGLADMIITTTVIPTSIVVLISGQGDTLPVCQAMQILTQAASYSYNLFFMMVGFENYYRVCRSSFAYWRFIYLPVAFISVLIFIISFAVSGAGVYLQMDYDYCKRQSYGNFTFRLTTSIALLLLPFITTLMLLVSTALAMRARARRSIHYRRSQQYEQESAFTNLNIFCYCLFVIAWIPYLVIVNQYPDTSDSNYYNCAWLGILRTMITSFFYSSLNCDFRHAFAHLFYYCCCKSSITAPFINRHRRGFEYKITAGEVKVHLMHHSVLVSNSPARPGCSRQRAHHALEL